MRRELRARDVPRPASKVAFGAKGLPESAEFQPTAPNHGINVVEKVRKCAATTKKVTKVNVFPMINSPTPAANTSSPP